MCGKLAHVNKKGLDGLSSGEVSSPVAGSKYVIHGYKSSAVWNPYRSYIIREA